MDEKKINKIITYSFFSFYLFIGVFTLNDYGINIEEHTQIYSGFFWLNYVYEFFQIDFLKNEIADELGEITKDRDLPNPKIFTYGPVFDLPTAFLDVLINSKDNFFKFQQRHILTFLFYFLSAIVFLKILLIRFKNFIVSFAGTLLYVFSPRIYGDSFHNNKDILFLSLVVLSIFFIIKIFRKSKTKHIILFSLFAALSTSTRIFGLFLPISLILFLFVDTINKKEKIVKKILLIVSTYIFFLILHWPYLWEDPVNNFFNFILKSKTWIFSYHILYDGNYLLTTGLPDSFLFKWIGISTPIFNLILFIFGAYLLYARFFNRLISIESKNDFRCDFWRSKKEMIDYFIIFNITSILLLIVFLNVSFASGWRHLYYLNFFMIYISTFCLSYSFLKFKKNHNILKIIFIAFFALNIYKIIIFHPYQSLYLNELVKKKNNYLIDREGLTRLESINKILSFEKEKKQVNLANSSFLPYYRIQDALSDKINNKIVFVGTDYSDADYIFNNFVYEVNPRFNDKYKIPQNFEQIYILEIDGIKIYEIYKKY